MPEQHLDSLVTDLLDTVRDNEEPTRSERDRMHARMLDVWKHESDSLGSEPTVLLAFEDTDAAKVRGTEPEPVRVADRPGRVFPALAAVAAALVLIFAGVSLLRSPNTSIDAANGAAAPTTQARNAANGDVVLDVEADIGDVTASFSTGEPFLIESFGPSHLEIRATGYDNPFGNDDTSLAGSVLLFRATGAFDLDEVIRANGLDTVTSDVEFAGERVTVESILIPGDVAAERGCAQATPCIPLDGDLANGPSASLEFGLFNDIRILPVGDDIIVMVTVQNGLRVGASNDPVSRLRDQVFETLTFDQAE